MPLEDEINSRNQRASADDTVDYLGSNVTRISGTLSQILEELHIVNRQLDKLESGPRVAVSPQFDPREISPPIIRGQIHTQESLLTQKVLSARVLCLVLLAILYLVRYKKKLMS